MVANHSSGPRIALLQVRGVGKRYGKGFWGMRGANLELGSGILGLVGPNGAGKSTLMRVLATITKPTEGTVLWEGEDLASGTTNRRRQRR